MLLHNKTGFHAVNQISLNVSNSAQYELAYSLGEFVMRSCWVGFGVLQVHFLSGAAIVCEQARQCEQAHPWLLVTLFRTRKGYHDER